MSKPSSKQERERALAAAKQARFQELDSDEEFDDNKKEKKQEESKQHDPTSGDALLSDAAFRASFDPNAPNHHGGLKTVVPVGGARVPKGMEDHANWQDLPEQPIEKVDSAVYGVEYVRLEIQRKELDKLKKAINAVGPLCAAILVTQARLEEAGGDEVKQKLTTALETEEKKRDAALSHLATFYDTFPRSTPMGEIITNITNLATITPWTPEANVKLGDHSKQATRSIFNESQRLMQAMKVAKKEHLAKNKE